MNVLITGLGSIGQRHIRNIKVIKPDAHITVWHQHTKTPLASRTPLDIDKEVFSLDEALLSRPDIALMTNPASLHIKTAIELAQHNIHLFIEKPLSNSLIGIDELIKLSDRKNLIVMVGYVLRFYEPLRTIKQAISNGTIGRPLYIHAEVGQYLPDWRPGRDYSQTVSSQNALGGGAILELSHELDYVRWMMGEVEYITAIAGHLSDLKIDTEDVAEISLMFKNGAIGGVHLDMVQRVASRNCKVVGTDGTLTWESSNHKVSLFSAKDNTWLDLHPALEIDRNEMFINEIKHFLECVESGRQPEITIEDGLRTLQLALAIKKSAEEHRAIAL